MDSARLDFREDYKLPACLPRVAIASINLPLHWVDGTQTKFKSCRTYLKRYYGFDVQRAASNAIFSDAWKADEKGS